MIYERITVSMFFNRFRFLYPVQFERFIHDWICQSGSDWDIWLKTKIHIRYRSACIWLYLNVLGHVLWHAESPLYVTNGTIAGILNRSEWTVGKNRFAELTRISHQWYIPLYENHWGFSDIWRLMPNDFNHYTVSVL